MATLAAVDHLAELTHWYPAAAPVLAVGGRDDTGTP